MKDEKFNNCCGGMIAADGSQDPAPKISAKGKIIYVIGLIAFAWIAVYGVKKIMGK